jgi:endogenous inhibitor of DNA gyrase (YacG/DUF329 family)
MKNSELLDYYGNILSELNKQKQYVLRQYIRQKPCPNCATPLNYFEASGIAIDDIDMSEAKDPKMACPACKRELIWTLPMTGDWHWRLVPITVVQE